MLTDLLNGEQALAYGAWAAGVRVVTGYPGSPSIGVVEHLMTITTPEEVRIQWSANEKVAFETAVGASLAGQRALVCMKSVGLNVALDPLMTANLTGVRGGLVIIVGDDPGAWASQNEQDSRYLAAFAELPLLEPTSPAEGALLVGDAFDLSEEIGLPIVVREIRDFSQLSGMVSQLPRTFSRSSEFTTRNLRWVSLPFNVVANHRRLHHRLGRVISRFDHSPFNAIDGQGSIGIVTAGFAYTKLLHSLPEGIPPDVSVLKLNTLYPLPESLLTDFLADKREVLVLEEPSPFLEERLQGLAHRKGLATHIIGKGTEHLPRTGAMTSKHIKVAVARLLGASFPFSTGTEEQRSTRPSEQGLCERCFYIPLFESLRDTLAELDQQAIICADPGCAIRIHQPPFEMLHVKQCMGSATNLAAGLWLAGVDSLPIALMGDSSFFHSGLNGLLTAISSGAHILVLILDNGSAALTGGQPHPGSGRDARGSQTQFVHLEGLLNGCGVSYLTTVDPLLQPALRKVMLDAIQTPGLRVILAQGTCIRTSILE